MSWKLTTVLLVAACTDFDLPSELSREQILAIRAAPAEVPAGQRARLEVLLAGPGGVEAEPACVWSTPSAGISIEIDEAGDAWLVVPADAAAGVAVLTLAVEPGAGGGELLAEKLVPIGGVARENPVLVGLEADGRSILGAELRVARGTITNLAATVDGADEPQLSWFANRGMIERYRQNPTELEADEAGQGTLVVVGRDGAGGVDWQVVPLVVSDG